MTQSITREQTTEPARRPASRQIAPLVDIYENEQELLLVADLPGVEPAALRVSLDPPQLQIEAVSSLGEGEPVTFKRVFRVDERIDPDSIVASLNAGVLRIQLKKSAALRPRRIEVKSS